MNVIYMDHEDALFKKTLRISMTVYLLVGIGVALIHVSPSRYESSEITPRIARLIVKPKKVEPLPLPVKPETNKEPSETRADKPKAEKKPDPSRIERNKEIARKSGAVAALIREQDSGRLEALLGKGKLNNPLTAATIISAPSQSMKKGRDPVNPLRKSSRTEKKLAQVGSLKGSDRVNLREEQKLVSALPKTPGPLGGGSGINRPLGDGALVRMTGGPSGADGGSIDYDAIAQVVEKYKKGILYLYNRELRSNPTLKGTITVEFSIDSTGRVVAVHLVSTTMDYATLEDALTRRIKQWKFPYLYDGIIVVTYPFVFFPV